MYLSTPPSIRYHKLFRKWMREEEEYISKFYKEPSWNMKDFLMTCINQQIVSNHNNASYSKRTDQIFFLQLSFTLIEKMMRVDREARDCIDINSCIVNKYKECIKDLNNKKWTNELYYMKYRFSDLYNDCQKRINAYEK